MDDYTIVYCMKPVQICRPFKAELKKNGLEISCIPKNMIDRYVRRMRKNLDEAAANWVETRLYRSSNLDDLAAGFMKTIIPAFAKKLEREYKEDVRAHS